MLDKALLVPVYHSTGIEGEGMLANGATHASIAIAQQNVVGGRCSSRPTPRGRGRPKSLTATKTIARKTAICSDESY